MKRKSQNASHLWDFSSGVDLGGEVSSYRQKENIYTQGEPAETLFYIQKGGVRLSTRRNKRPSAVTAILGVGDFFGELCLADYPLRMCTAVALTAKFRARRSELFCLQGVAISFRHYVAGSCQVLTGFMTSVGICSVA